MVQDSKTAHVDKGYRDSMEYFSEDSGVTDMLYEVASEYYNNYSKDKFEPIQYIGYVPGQQFKLHYDVGLLESINRTHSILIYLNDDFEGGETVFPFLDISITPKKGRAIIFPNIKVEEGIAKEITFFSYHGTLPIHNGRKYIALFCKTDTPRNHENWQKFYKPIKAYEESES